MHELTLHQVTYALPLVKEHLVTYLSDQRMIRSSASKCNPNLFFDPQRDIQAIVAQDFVMDYETYWFIELGLWVNTQKGNPFQV